jgi:predicted phosphate transport protein (TIGR00153 family)
MGFKEFLIPEEKKFFDELEKEVAIVKQGAELLLKLTTEYHKLEHYAQKLDNIEHECDCVVHDITKMLNNTFITPIDREDIHSLATEIDDVIDIIDAVGRRLMIFKIFKCPKYLPENAELILKSVNEMEAAVKNLRDPKKIKSLEKHCIEVNDLENESDHMLAKALGELFEGDDVKFILKMKEIYDLLEFCTDKAEEVANHLLEISGKNA